MAPSWSDLLGAHSIVGIKIMCNDGIKATKALYSYCKFCTCYCILGVKY